MRAARIMGLTAVLVGVAPVVFAGVSPESRCKDAKAKATGNKAAAVLKAAGKNAKSPSPARLARDVSKAQSKFTKAFVKAEGKGGCLTTGDAPAKGANPPNRSN